MYIVLCCLNVLTFWCLLPGSSGCAVAPPTAGHPQCQRWKRQRSRGGGRFRAWAGCPTAESLRSAYLVGQRINRVIKKWRNYAIFCAQNKYRCFKLTCVTAEFCISCGGEPLTGPQVKTQSDNLYWSRELGTDHFGPAVNIITSDDNTPSDSLTLLFPVGFNLTTLPLAGIIKPHAVSVHLLLSDEFIISGVRDPLPEVCTMCSDPFHFYHSFVTLTLFNDDN